MKRKIVAIANNLFNKNLNAEAIQVLSSMGMYSVEAKDTIKA